MFGWPWCCLKDVREKFPLRTFPLSHWAEWKSSKSWIFQMSVRRLWEGPWWFWLIERWSVMLLLVVWECLGLSLVDLKQLPFDRLATEGQNPTFTFPWYNGRVPSGPTKLLAHFWLKNFHLLAQYPLFMYNLRKIRFWIFRKTFILTDRPPNSYWTFPWTMIGRN